MPGSGSDKDILRKAMFERREELHARDPDAGEMLAEKFPMKLFERYGPTVSAYFPIRSEIDPQPLINRLAAAGADICLPRLEADTMVFRRWTPGDPLEAGRFGLSEPPETAEALSPTLVLVPLLAFDDVGNRLGYGAGHFDRALAALRSQGRAFACGLGFNGQLIDTLPADPHDQPLDWAMTETGSYPIFMMRNMREIRAQ